MSVYSSSTLCRVRADDFIPMNCPQTKAKLIEYAVSEEMDCEELAPWLYEVLTTQYKYTSAEVLDCLLGEELKAELLLELDKELSETALILNMNGFGRSPNKRF